MPARPLLGLFFTDTSIEISLVSKNGNSLGFHESVLLQHGVVVNGEIKNLSEFKKQLSLLMSMPKPRPVKFGDKVVVGVGGNRVFLREFSLPKYIGKEIEDAIEYQVRSLLPLLPSGVETDWQIIGRDEEGKVEVLLAAVPKAIIQSYMSAISSVGLQVVSIEPAVFANIRVISQSIIKQKDQLLVYMGDDFAEFTYMTNGNPRFSDFLPSSEISRKGGIVNAIRDYVVFSNSKHLNRPIVEIVISGPSSECKNLVEKFRSSGVAAILANSRLSTVGDGSGQFLHTSIGLSLSTITKSKGFNLLPLTYRLEVLRDRIVEKWKSILSLLSLMLIVSIGALYYVYDSSVSEATKIQSLIDNYRRQIDEPKSKELINSTKDLNQFSDQLIYLRESMGNESLLFQSLSEITPQGVSLTSLIYSRGADSTRLVDSKSDWSLTGVATSRSAVLDFYNKLISKEIFSNGKLYFGSLDKDSGLSFRISTPSKQ